MDSTLGHVCNTTTTNSIATTCANPLAVAFSVLVLPTTMMDLAPLAIMSAGGIVVSVFIFGLVSRG